MPVGFPLLEIVKDCFQVGGWNRLVYGDGPELAVVFPLGLSGGVQ